jgi:hypothetical protein
MLIDLLRALDFSQPQTTVADTLSRGSIDKELSDWMMQEFLEQNLSNMSFGDIMDMVDEDTWGAEPVKLINTPELRKFKPLQIHKLPTGPNSVFNLAASMSV